MSCLGVHFAVTASVARRLRAAEGHDAVLEIIEEIEEAWDKAHL